LITKLVIENGKTSVFIVYVMAWL